MVNKAMVTNHPRTGMAGFLSSQGFTPAQSQKQPAKMKGGCMAFSMREYQILDLLRTGQTNKEIGQNLGISANPVRDHIGRMLLRTGVKTRVALAALYIRQDKAVVWCPVEVPDRRNSIDRRAPVAPQTLQM